MTIPQTPAGRRDRFFAATRRLVPELFHPDGVGKIPQFEPPWREPVRILPALFLGDDGDRALANRIVARYGAAEGPRFRIFQSTILAGLLHGYHDRLTPEAAAVMTDHARLCFRTYGGAAQTDYKFHGANDNMPMMATKALILAGEFLDDEAARDHGVWNLYEFRNLLSRCAWASEFNSSTYSPITLANLAQIAESSRDAGVRRLALDCERRIWAELLLHYHPGTLHSAGPRHRGYAVDCAGHNHSLELVFWLMFGAEATGRDLLRSCFAPDPGELFHFGGQPFQNIAEYCEILDAPFHLPSEFARLVTERRYPARLAGRAEDLYHYLTVPGEIATTTYMEKEFSLGSATSGFSNSQQVFATYRLRPEVASWRDASTLFHRYFLSDTGPGVLERSADGSTEGEVWQPHEARDYTLQKDNTVLLLAAPARNDAKPVRTACLKLSLVFPAHFGRNITRSALGTGQVRNGAEGASMAPEPVSLEIGEVFLHVRPLLLSALPRKEAIRFRTYPRYETLELVNYEGPERDFTPEELLSAQNGYVLTLDAKARWSTLEAFHAAMSDARILDYFMVGVRFFKFVRRDVRFEVAYSPEPFGVKTCLIDGRNAPRPLMSSSEIDVETLPFLGEPQPEDAPDFPWRESLQTPYRPDALWLLGSRGVVGEQPYATVLGNNPIP